jgi:putative peptidoglycan binding protein
MEVGAMGAATRGQEGEMGLHIADPVGDGGLNRRTDVWGVQTLLIKIRKAQGDPGIQLDGYIGPETIGAIRKFQTRQFGWQDPDGRVDPNGITLKHLNLVTDTSGPTTTLLEPVTVKRQGRWELKIGADGQIVVRPGDWLSKYSALMDGNFYTIWPYMRFNADGKFVAIANPNLIRVGESLYHIPTFLDFYKKNSLPPPPVPQQKPLSEEERRKVTESFLSGEYNLTGDRLHAVSKALDHLNEADSALTVIDVAGLIAEGGVLAGAATGIALANAILGAFGLIIASLNALETMSRMAGMRAVAYATVAWAFNEPSPAFSRELEGRMRDGLTGQPEINRCKRAWTNAAMSAVTELKKAALGRYGNGRSPKSQAFLIESAKQRLVAAGEGDRKKLCLFLMKAFEDNFSGELLNIWKAGYDYLYNQ